MTLLRDLVDIPERVDPGDFVLKLIDGVANPADTIGKYVVTEQLAEAFDKALGLVGGAVQANGSRATYLHGSFGSGKSHFMALLDLLLSGQPAARAIPELAPVVAKHDQWLSGGDRKFLVVPVMVMGAESLEHAVFKGYVDHLTRVHPEAKPPAGVYRAGPILEDAEGLRATMGDERFFAALNEATGDGSGGGDDGWGALAEEWTPETFTAAAKARFGDPEQVRLVGDVTATLLPSYAGVARNEAGAYVGMADGLSAMSNHARSLGYHGLVLFLDELVLWLSMHVYDTQRVTLEVNKLSELVESANPDRPVPIVSFIARQRDLASLVGSHAVGNEYTALYDRLNHVSGRIPNPIVLEDRNLPVIAAHRLLQPKSAAAREEIDAAFRTTERVRSEVLQTLLGRDAVPGEFRLTYPFSPAFMTTLVAVSGALQRERTALKVMAQLLVDRRDELELGHVVPVGDLWDVILGQDEPFEATMKERFATAKSLYRTSLRPTLLEIYGLQEAQVAGLPRTHEYVGADRLVKTLLLAALVPEIEPFKDLTARRLAALNHGTIDSPLPGGETRIVLQILQTLQGRSGAVQLGDDPANPTVAIVLSGVDTAAIIEAARSNDTRGARQRLVKEIVEDEIGIKADGQLTRSHTFVWRGTRRTVDVAFHNVRDAADLPNSSFTAPPGSWKVIVDYPFDDEGFTPREDYERVRSLANSGTHAQVLCWLPTFFSPATRNDLGRLVVLEHLLASNERLDEHTRHLSATDRHAAKGQLDNQRGELRRSIRQAIHMAYGIAAGEETVVDVSHSPADRFPTLVPLRVQPPVAAHLGQALEGLLDQLFSHSFPGHPDFGQEVTAAKLRKVRTEVQRLFADENGRIVPEPGMRPLLRDIATPLRLGTQSEQGFVRDDFWLHQFFDVIKQSETIGGPVTVGALRSAFDQPTPRGLPTVVQNLVLLLVAEKLGYSFQRYGGPFAGPDVDALPDDLELHKLPLPDDETWNRAQDNAATLFGIGGGRRPLLPNNVDELRARVQEAARAHRDAAHELVVALEGRAATVGIDIAAGPGPDRLRTARVSHGVLDELLAAAPEDVLAVLAGATPATTREAMARSLTSAADVSRLLQDDRWRMIGGAFDRLGGEHLKEQMAERLSADELVAPLQPVFDLVWSRSQDLMMDPGPAPAPPGVPVDPGGGTVTVPTPPPAQPTPPTPPAPPPARYEAGVASAEELDAVIDRLRSALDEPAEGGSARRLRIWWELEE